MATKKLSIALAALTTPTFNYEVTMPSFKIGATSVTATGVEMNYLMGVTSGIQAQINAKLASTSFTGAGVLALLLAVDGAGSGLDADLLDGHSSAYFQVANADSTGASGSVKTTNFTIIEVGGVLVFKYGTTEIASLTSAGVWSALNEGEFFDSTV